MGQFRLAQPAELHIKVVTAAAPDKTIAPFTPRGTAAKEVDMKLLRTVRQGLVLTILIVISGSSLPSAKANVYATNIKLNSSTTNVIAPPNSSVDISYILNEPATLGVTLKILSGATTVRTLSITNGQGTLAGANTVTWDGKDSQSNTVPLGSYSVSITASTSGYTNWTQITSDGPVTYVYDGRGIAADQNTNSFYYGRIFIANALEGAHPDSTPGDVLGVLKLNADGSPADEGASSATQDGFTWTGQDKNPWKLAVSADDNVYVDDLSNDGQVYRWDPTFSSNTLVQVLRADNQKTGATLDNLTITGSGTNTQLWMVDSASTLGVVQWALTNNGTCATNDQGTSIVGLGGSLTLGPTGVAVDKSGNIYVCQSVGTPGDPSPRVFRFAPYDPSTNANAPETAAVWAVGAGDDTYGSASSIAVDPTGTYLAVSFEGVYNGAQPDKGNTKILYATNGAIVTNLDLGIAMDGLTDTEHQNTCCAWDAVGNVYYVDNWYGYWRAFSPPGTNQSTTLAVINVTFQPATAVLTGISVSNGIVTISFTGPSNPASSFTLVSASTPAGPYSAANGSSITSSTPGVFTATAPVSGVAQFYRVKY